MKTWQTKIAVLGSLIWFVLMGNLKYILTLENSIINVVSGYTMGFITAFSAQIFWEITRGGYKRILGEKTEPLRYITAIPLFLLAILGLLGFLNSILNSMPWQYTIPFAIATIVIN